MHVQLGRVWKFLKQDHCEPAKQPSMVQIHPPVSKHRGSDKQKGCYKAQHCPPSSSFWPALPIIFIFLANKKRRKHTTFILIISLKLGGSILCRKHPISTRRPQNNLTKWLVARLTLTMLTQCSAFCKLLEGQQKQEMKECLQKLW